MIPTLRPTTATTLTAGGSWREDVDVENGICADVVEDCDVVREFVVGDEVVGDEVVDAEVVDDEVVDAEVVDDEVVDADVVGAEVVGDEVDDAVGVVAVVEGTTSSL